MTSKILVAFITITLLVGLKARGESARPQQLPLAVKAGDSVLLLDDHTVAGTKNLTQQFFPAKRHPSNPVLRRSEKWEGVGPYIWGTRLLQDEKAGELRLWYIAYDYA